MSEMPTVRTLSVEKISEAVARLCSEANRRLPASVSERMNAFGKEEDSPLAKSVMADLCRNLELAAENQLPVCQDTGMAVVFAELGQELRIIGGDFESAIHEGVRRGYRDGYLRCSVVEDPLRRKNTGDNTPAVIHTRIVPGDKLTLTVAPKGFGSENMSAVRMLTPAADREAIIAAVLDIVKAAGSNPCPPMVLGIGLGGDFELCALLAKKALIRCAVAPNPDSYYAQLERDILHAVNQLGIGPQGFGGKTTAIAVGVEVYPTHIAGLPLAVNVGCYVNRHAKAIL